MKIKYFINFVFAFLVLTSCESNGNKATDLSRWEKQAANISITRDQWGVPHVYGKTDADAVFGLLYAQCEDDFNRVEVNYATALGRMAEYEGGQHFIPIYG